MKNKKKLKIKFFLIFCYHIEEAIHVNKIRDIKDRVLRIVQNVGKCDFSSRTIGIEFGQNIGASKFLSDLEFFENLF